MKTNKYFIALFSSIIISKYSFSQNIMLNVVTLNSGIVKKNEQIFFEVTISNTDAINVVPEYKLKPQISFPDNYLMIPDSGHVLPSGWVLLSNKKGVVILSNGTDIIPQNTNRIILIALRGKEVCGQTSIIGNLNFGNGVYPGNINGAPTVGDKNSDNSSTSSIKVIN